MANVEPEFGGILHLRLPYLPPHRTERTSQRMGLDTCLNECRSLKNFRCCSVGFFCFVLFILLQHTPPQLKQYGGRNTSRYYPAANPVFSYTIVYPKTLFKAFKPLYGKDMPGSPPRKIFNYLKYEAGQPKPPTLAPNPKQGYVYIYIFFLFLFWFFFSGVWALWLLEG